MKVSPEPASGVVIGAVGIRKSALRKSRTQAIQDGHGEIDIVPTRWEKLLAGSGCCCCPSPCNGCCWGFMCVLIPLIIGLAIPLLKFTDEFGWQVISDPLTQAHYAHAKLIDIDLEKGTSLFPDKDPETTKIAYEDNGPQASLLYVAKGTKCPRDEDNCDLTKGNLLSTRNMGLIKRFEDKLYNDTKYQKYCLKVEGGLRCAPMSSFAQSSGYLAALMALYRSPTGKCNLTNVFPGNQLLPSSMDGLAKDASLQMLCNPELALKSCDATAAYFLWNKSAPLDLGWWRNSPFAHFPTCRGKIPESCPHIAQTMVSWIDGTRPFYFPKFACEDKSPGMTNIEADGVPFLQSYLPFGYPVDRNVTGDIDEDEESERLKDRYASDFFALYVDAGKKLYEDSDKEIEVLVEAGGIIGQLETQMIQYTDMGLMGFSFIMVFSYMWFTTGNLFISGMGMIQIVFSLGPPFLIWLVMIKPSGIQFFQLLAVFLILGIGADDVFVLNDAWEHTKKEMLKNGGPLDIEKLMAVSYRQAFSAMLSTTATTALCFMFGSISGIPFISWVSFFAAMVVIFDFVWCITLLAATVAFNERKMSDTLCCCFGKTAPEGKCGQPGCCWGCVPLMFSKCKSKSEGGEDEVSGIEKFLGGPFFEFVNKAKIPLLVFWGVVLILMIVSISLGVGIADSNPDGYPSGHPIQRRADIKEKYFSSSYGMQVNVFWGFDEKNPVKEWVKTNEARELNMGSISDAISVSGQQKILDFCEAPDNEAGLRCDSESCTVKGLAEARSCGNNTERVCSNNTAYGCYLIPYPTDSSCSSGRNCIMELVKEYADQVAGLQFPVEDLSAVMSSGRFSDYLNLRFQLYAQKGLAWKFQKPVYQRQTGVFFDKDTSQSGASIKHLWVSFNATFSCYFCPAAEGKDHFEKWDSFVSGKVAGTGAYHLNCIMFLFKVFQDRMVAEALQSLGLAIAVSLVTMCLVTWNWLIALIGTFNIASIMVVFMGTWPALGWKFNMFTCLFLIMAVGMSVDYTLHILHAYNESSQETRYLRTREAVSHMGVTVFSGAITTLLAAAPMFACTTVFFSMFGTFIFMIILYSILLALLLLVPLLLLIGPQGGFGDIWCFYELAAKIKGSKKEEKEGLKDNEN